jgi:hypothetical protein
MQRMVHELAAIVGASSSDGGVATKAAGSAQPGPKDRRKPAALTHDKGKGGARSKPAAPKRQLAHAVAKPEEVIPLDEEDLGNF